MLIELGMTKDDATKATQPNAAGAYEVEFMGFQAKDGKITRETKGGGTMLVAKLKLLPPATNPSTLFYNAVVGSFSFADFVEAFPDIFVGTGVDEDRCKGQRAKVVLSVEPAKDRDGNVVEGQFRNNITKLKNINAA